MVMTQRIETRTEEDRLSSLPDALLTHILSFLSTKESFCTSILSTRWKFLFAYVPTLCFCSEDLETSGNFVRFVNRMLRVHDVPCITSFRLFVVNGSCRVSAVTSWISAAIRRNPRLLEVGISPLYWSNACRLPSNLFTCQMLVHLKLHGNFVIGVTDPVCLPNLKTLGIACFEISDVGSVSKLLSSCPVLEDLTFEHCYISVDDVLSVSIPSLKRLTLLSLNSVSELELNVPNLEYIRCLSKAPGWNSVNTLKSLHKAVLEVSWRSEEDKLWELVNKCDQVQFLLLSGDSMMSLAVHSISMPIFNKLKTLELQSDNWEGWKLSQAVLNRSPCLELLVIQEDEFLDPNEDLLEIDILLPECVPSCFSRSLKEVNLCWLKVDTIKYEWLGYLLKNATILEKLSIHVGLLREQDEEYFAYLERQFIIRKKLLALPRGSNTCEIVVGEYSY